MFKICRLGSLSIRPRRENHPDIAALLQNFCSRRGKFCHNDGLNADLLIPNSCQRQTVMHRLILILYQVTVPVSPFKPGQMGLSDVVCVMCLLVACVFAFVIATRIGIPIGILIWDSERKFKMQLQVTVEVPELQLQLKFLSCSCS